jgi:ubiquinone/menaquinone biosynthesis C-methylase UbiE
MGNEDPRIGSHYDDLADRWADIVDTEARDDVLWSTLESMLPDPPGARVLDAGCGSGVFTARLADAGADVVGVDLSEEMLAVARDRVPDGRFLQADVADGLDELDADGFDVVLCQHVLSHVESLETPFEAFARVLEDGGTLVVSTHNPVRDYCVVREERQPTAGEHDELETTVHTFHDHPTYTETERFDVTYGGDDGTRGTYYRRSFEAVLSPLLSAGFGLDAVAEPNADDSNDVDADGAPFPPGSLCLRATR